MQDGTFGTPTRLPWGLNFGDGIARHPTNLYEILFLAALALLFGGLARRSRPLPDGRRFELFLAAYLLFRLLVEFVKPTPTAVVGLTAIQWACVAGLGYYIWLWTRRRASAALEVS